jgi:hypothetical protein
MAQVWCALDHFSLLYSDFLSEGHTSTTMGPSGPTHSSRVSPLPSRGRPLVIRQLGHVPPDKPTQRAV